MRKPDCLICGAQKGGTRALIDYLDEHPDIFTYPHEPNYFSRKYHRSITWYLNKFKNAKPHEFLIEKSPQYMIYPDAPQRIKDTLPYVKLIFILRDPVKRAYSHYWMSVSKGKEKRTFREAIEDCWNNYPDGKPEPCIYNYISRGFYAEQIKRYRDVFPDEQMLVLRSEDLRHHTQRELDRVCGFLGLPCFTYYDIPTKKGTVPKSKFVTYLLSFSIFYQKEYKLVRLMKDYLTKINKGEPYPPIGEDDKKYLEDIYEKTKSKVYVAFE